MRNILILLRGNSICYIPDSTIVQGTITLKVPGYIHGTVNGDVHSTARLYLGSSGVINGNINAEEVIIEGKVEGSIFSMMQAIIRKHAIVKGDVNASPLVLERDGVILGRVNAPNGDINENAESFKFTTDPIDNNGDSEVPPATWF